MKEAEIRKSPEEQLKIILKGAADCVNREELLKKLEKGTPLTVKLGLDPSAPDIHLGHAVPLRKLRQFQDLGHQVTLIIGDGTALIGDPSGRNTTRPQLSREKIQENAQTYVDQAFKILDPEKTVLRYNSEWILDLNMESLLKLLANFTVARILERDDFHNRYTSGQSISLHEFLYPVMQAYDSVVIKADVELGGTDQLFNLLAGRELMEKMGMEPQVCLTLPLLEGTDGVKKMSKSYGNYIGLTDEAADMFGKVMSIPDELMVKYYRLASTEAVDEIDRIEAGLAADELHPNKVKRALARNIVAAYYDDVAAEAAEAIGIGLQSFCIPGSVAEDRKVGLGHGNLGAMLLRDETKCFAFLAGHESFAAAEGAIGIVKNANKARKQPLRVILNGLGKDAAQIISRINGFTYVQTQFDYYTGKLNIVREIRYSEGERADVRCYGADDVREGVAIMHHEGVDVSITGNSTNPTRFQHPVAGTYKKECIEQGKKYFSVASGGGTGRTLHPDNMAAGPASYGMTDTMGRMHSDAQFAGSSSVPAHVDMMGLIGMGNNPMVGATVAVAVAVAEGKK